MLQRRKLLLALPLAAAACAGESEPVALPPLVSGYRHLTPLRLNVADVEMMDPAPGAVRVDEPVTLRPEREMLRMGQDRLVPMGSEGQARFIVQVAEFRRERVAQSGGITGFFAGDPGERLTCRMQARLEVTSGDGRRAGFVEAEARRMRTLGDGSSPAARNRAAEELVRQTIEELNVEFEFQVRRALRAWLVDGTTPPQATGPAGIEREDLPRN